MNKNELVSEVAERTGLTKVDAEKLLKSLAEVATEELIARNKVTLPGLGILETVEVAERSGIIQMGDKKGEIYTTPAHVKPRFKPTSALKDAVK